MSWRTKILDWYGQLAECFGIREETVSVATNLLDRYLAVRSCTALEFQLVATTALFIAQKSCEVHPLGTKDFTMLACGRFCSRDICLMELDMLTTLRFFLNPPTAIEFVDLLLVVYRFEGHVDVSEVQALSRRFVALARRDMACLVYSPMLVAVTSLLCALRAAGAHRSVTSRLCDAIKHVDPPYAQNGDSDVLSCAARLLAQSPGLAPGLPKLAASATKAQDAENGDYHNDSPTTVIVDDRGERPRETI